MQQLKPILTAMRMTIPFEAVASPVHTQVLDDAGKVRPTGIMDSSADLMLGELARLASVLAPLRA